MAEQVFLAVDLGASSGRHVAGRFDGDRLTLEEVHRFGNGPVSAAGHLYWDLLGLWQHVVEACVRRPANSAGRSTASAFAPGASISVCSAAATSCSATPIAIAIAHRRHARAGT